jgi:glycogen operon protein
MNLRTWPGKPYPLGATWDGMGVNFALFSEHAESVELCLFDSVKSTREAHRIKLTEYTDNVWHVYLPDIRPGQLYGYRVHGPYSVIDGHRFNAKKVLLDPYAKAVARPMRWHDSMFGYRLGLRREDGEMDRRNNAGYAPLAAVVDSAFSWGDDRSPNTPWNETVIYEAHVKGLTALQPLVPPNVRGTFAGLCCEPVIRHLQDLGVTAIELMPLHQKADEWHLHTRKLTNYWGYNTLSFFAPDIRFTSYQGQQSHVREFKTMVSTLHAAGIEVILDVVYNHTCEGDHLGPTLSFRGIDNASYYRQDPNRAGKYLDFTGCGNTLNMRHPRVLQLIMDSLRYWTCEMHVDGFRFDLASALARELYEVNKLAAFFDIIHQDPVLSRVKLIAEPWDLGEGGYQVGNFPVLWTEWNGRYRDTVRGYWKGDRGMLSEFATRLSGSSDLYDWGARKPYASINFMTCHDGFSLTDLVSYNNKHNSANGEDNRDGTNDNRSWNCGVEGPTEDPNILALRLRQRRNFMATLVLSVGVPMINGGDELSRTQQGNNNPYCQDNSLSWYPWNLGDEEQAFLRFTQNLVSFRKGLPVLRRRGFFRGKVNEAAGVKDLTWYGPEGHELAEHHWRDASLACLGACFAGDAIEEPGIKGEHVMGDTLLVLTNAHNHPVEFRLPRHKPDCRWQLIMDTVDGLFLDPPKVMPSGDIHRMDSKSLALLKLEDIREGTG